MIDRDQSAAHSTNPVPGGEIGGQAFPVKIIGNMVARQRFKMWEKIKRYGLTIARAMLTFVLPPRCLSCDRPVANDGGLCGQCWSELSMIDAPLCEKTGRPLAYDLGEGIVSAEAVARPPVYNRLRAAALYESVAQRLVLLFKFHDRPELAAHLVPAMARAGRTLIADADVIVPVPLHRKRLYERRYNQAAELAKVLARRSSLPLSLLALQRIRATSQQTQLDLQARQRNVQGAFHVSAERALEVEGKRVLLVDDVVTTGATVEACARALLRAGADHVDVLTYAMVVDDLEPTI